MRITIKAKNLELTEELQNFIEEKIGSLKKFVKILKEERGEGKTLAEAFVEVEKETRHHKKGKIFKAEAQISLPGKILMAQARGEDLPGIVVKLKDALQQEIKKYRLKNKELNIRKQRKELKEN